MAMARAAWPRLATLLLLAALAGGCARPVQPPGEPVDMAAAHAAWNTFRRMAENATVQGFALTASCNYAGKAQSRRVVLRLWGGTDLPLRLDLRAGIGATVALFEETGSGFTAYVPDRSIAYLAPDSRAGLGAFGLRLPFGLPVLARLATGGLWEAHGPENMPLLPAAFAGTRLVPGQGFAYDLGNTAPVSLVVLDFEGRPLRWEGPASHRWTLEFFGHNTVGEGRFFPPDRMTLTMPSGDKALLAVKELALRATPWPDEALALPLPPGTRLERIPGLFN
ncbi:MAG: hypothetical protein AB7E47_11630 [Desulfovibrionaceae bacterium]